MLEGVSHPAQGVVTVEGTRTWEKFCNRNGFYYTHTSADYFNGNSPVVGLGG